MNQQPFIALNPHRALYGLTCLRATHRQAPEEIAIVYDSSSGGGRNEKGTKQSKFVMIYKQNSKMRKVR